jgi:hypothetical protein
MCDDYEVPQSSIDTFSGPAYMTTLYPFPADENFAYEGEYSQGKRHGQGIMRWPRAPHGRAKDLRPEIEFQTDESHIVVQFRGEWDSNKAHGFGEYRNAESGRTYNGEWADGKAHGYGEHYDRSTGSAYEHHYRGQWRNGLQHGQGEEFWSNGDRYVGEYRRGRKQGRGQFRWANQEIYQGEFVNDELHGSGQYFWTDGRVSTGTWRESKMNGAGLTTWPMGPDVTSSKWYNGEYLGNRRHGKGTYHFSDGREYTGEWDHGEKCGQGKYTTFLGVQQQGTWQKGKSTAVSLTSQVVEEEG